MNMNLREIEIIGRDIIKFDYDFSHAFILEFNLDRRNIQYDKDLAVYNVPSSRVEPLLQRLKMLFPDLVTGQPSACVWYLPNSRRSDWVLNADNPEQTTYDHFFVLKKFCGFTRTPVVST